MILHPAIAPRAQTQLEELDEWWRANRPASATDVVEGFRRVVELLCQQPHLGLAYRRRSARGVRYHPIAGTPYYVFYVPMLDSAELRVLAVWSATRGEGPPLT